MTSKHRPPKRKKKRPFRHMSAPAAAPGTLTAHPGAHPPEIQVTSYDKEHCETSLLSNVSEIKSWIGKRRITWINVNGLGSVEVIESIGRELNLHRLALEDVVNTHQRPKVEFYGDHLFIVTRMYSEGRGADSEQLSMFLGPNYVLTFQEEKGDCFDKVRRRIKTGNGRIRTLGCDYLAYALLDACVDFLFPYLESISGRMDLIEEDVFAGGSRQSISQIHILKRELLTLRRSVWPLRDALNSLIRDETPLITADTRLYIRDCLDHCIQLIDMLETYRELASGLAEAYLSQAGYRMNEIVKVLTIVSTIFIPLTFIAGIYGMNFDDKASPWNMPELHWKWGYPFVILLMIAVALAMLYGFRRLGWIGGESVFEESHHAGEDESKGDGEIR